MWIVESVRSAADASTIRQFKASSVAEGSGMIKQLLTANSAVPFHPGQGSHLRAELCAIVKVPCGFHLPAAYFLVSEHRESAL